MEKQDSNVKHFRISDYPMCYDAWLDARQDSNVKQFRISDYQMFYDASRIDSREVVIASSWLRTMGFESTIYVPDTHGWAMSVEDFTMFILRWS